MFPFQYEMIFFEGVPPPATVPISFIVNSCKSFETRICLKIVLLSSTKLAFIVPNKERSVIHYHKRIFIRSRR